MEPLASWLLFCKVDKGRDWTERALLLDPDLGDVWALYYSHELLHDPTRAAAVLARAVKQVSQPLIIETIMAQDSDLRSARLSAQSS